MANIEYAVACYNLVMEISHNIVNIFLVLVGTERKVRELELLRGRELRVEMGEQIGIVCVGIETEIFGNFLIWYSICR